VVLDLAPTEARAAATAAYARLKAWLNEAAYPLWSRLGFDPATGRFTERIDQDGVALDLPSRGRVPPRQIYAFAAAAGLGWKGDAQTIVRGGLEGFLRQHLRPDNLSRPLGGQGGEDGPVELYDQAFALFGLAAAHPFIDGGLEGRAIALRQAVRAKLGHPVTGFRTEWPTRTPLWSNPHMHLLEAALAWTELSQEPGWEALGEEIVALATSRFIDPRLGVLREFFAEDWSPAEGAQGRLVEPGHQFEWAWLLLRWSERKRDASLRAKALRLIEVGEVHGVDRVRGVAIDSLLDDLTPHGLGARLWPQTERIKAAALAARLTGESRYWEMAAAAVAGLEHYLATPVRGLWFDRMTPEGEMVHQPAPATSLYHIVLAIAVLEDCLDA
jgi:mannose-6-phosphate isomerase